MILTRMKAERQNSINLHLFTSWSFFFLYSKQKGSPLVSAFLLMPFYHKLFQSEGEMQSAHMSSNK